MKRYDEVRNFLNNEHSRYKEFLYLLKVVKRPETFSERKLRYAIKYAGGKLKSFSKVGERYSIEADNIRAKKLPFLLKKLEKLGEIGKGNFYLKLTLRVRNF